MPIHYSLLPNRLNAKNGGYKAQVHPHDSLDLEGLVDRMTARGSTVTRAEALGVMNEVFEVVEEVLAEGKHVNTPLFQVRFSVRGAFVGVADRFDRKRHALRVSLAPGSRLRQLADRLRVRKVEFEERAPRPKSCVDLGSGSRNKRLTLGGAIRIKGAGCMTMWRQDCDVLLGS